MATLDEIAKSFANNPVFKALDNLPLAAYSMPPGIASMSNAFDAISKLAAPSKNLANLMNYSSIGSSVVNAGIIGSGIGALAISSQKDHAQFFDTIRMVSKSNELASQTIAAAMGRPYTELQGLMQFAAKGLNTSAIAALASFPAVKFEPRPTQANAEFLRSIKRPERAPYQPKPDAVPASRPTLLPPEVEQSRIYITALIAELKTLPPSDIITVLDWQLSQQQGTARTLFLDRLAHYLADGKAFSPICWQVVTLWLSSLRRAVPTPTWHRSIVTDAAPVPSSPFEALLLGFTMQQLTELLTSLGLLTSNRQATSAARAGAWVGVIHGLLNAKPARLGGGLAAIQRAFCDVFGAKVSERAVQNGLGKRGSEAEKFYDSTLALLSSRTSAE